MTARVENIQEMGLLNPVEKKKKKTRLDHPIRIRRGKNKKKKVCRHGRAQERGSTTSKRIRERERMRKAYSGIKKENSQQKKGREGPIFQGERKG